MSDRQFSDGELIYRMGDPADGLYRVRSGGVHLQQGDDMVQPETSPLGADAVFGGDGFLTGETREADAIAVGEVVVEFLRWNEFLAILAVQPNLLSTLVGPVFNLVLPAAAAAPDLQSTKPDPLEAEAVENTKFDTAPFAPPPFEQSGPVPGNLDIRLVADGKRLRSAPGARRRRGKRA